MKIDRKYKFVAVNPCNQHVLTEESAVIFAAKDKCLPAALMSYISQCKTVGCGEEHIESMELLLQRVVEFQVANGSKIPDTDTPCEIDRCIGGKT